MVVDVTLLTRLQDDADDDDDDMSTAVLVATFNSN